MQLKIILPIIFIAFAVLTARPSAAGNLPDSFTLSPMAGGHFFEGDLGLDDDLSFGLALGYNYNRHWGTEILAFLTDTDAGTNGGSADVLVYILDGLYHFRPEGPLVPYLTLGAGVVILDPDDGGSDSSLALNYGAGVKWFLNDRLALRAEARHLIGFDQGLDEWSRTDHHLLVTAGLTVQFGAPALAPEPAPAEAAAPPSAVPAPTPAPSPQPGPPRTQAPAGPADRDEDGVPDDRDRCPHTARGLLVDAEGCPVSMEIHLEFDFDRTEIKPEHRDELQRAAEFIRGNPSPKILIAGHTDAIGTPSYNKELSQRRAAAVRQYLINNFSIEAARLVARGYGESRPIASNETAEGRQRNRRTEIICCVYIPAE